MMLKSDTSTLFFSSSSFQKGAWDMEAREAREIRAAVRRIARSPEYLGLAGFIVFFERGCRSSLIKRIARRYGKEIKILFRVLKRRIEKEMDKFHSARERMNLFRTIRRELPAFSKYFDLNI